MGREALRTIQERNGHIPHAEPQASARTTSIPRHHLHGLAPFSPHFRFEPPRCLQGRVGRALPCPDGGHAGTAVLFTATFPTGRAKLVPVDFRAAAELPNDEYPFVLNTERLSEHWHTRSMTRRAVALDALVPEGFVDMNAGDLRGLGLKDGDRVAVHSRRGAISLRCRASTKQAPGSAFIPFHFKEAAANLLTNDALDPTARIPEFKFCAVKVTPAA